MVAMLIHYNNYQFYTYQNYYRMEESYRIEPFAVDRNSVLCGYRAFGGGSSDIDQRGVVAGDTHRNDCSSLDEATWWYCLIRIVSSRTCTNVRSLQPKVKKEKSSDLTNSIAIHMK